MVVVVIVLSFIVILCACCGVWFLLSDLFREGKPFWSVLRSLSGSSMDFGQSSFKVRSVATCLNYLP